MNILNVFKAFFGLNPEYLRGIDTSVYEPNIDWPLVKTQNVNYVFMRASQGTYKDPEFVRMWSEAKGIMPRGAYHLFDGRYTSNKPSRQVEIFLEQLNGDFGELPFVLDLEGIFAAGKGYPYTGWRYWYDYLETLKAAVPEKEIMIYTAPYIWRDNTPAVGKAELNYFKQYLLWIAHYGVDTPLVPAPWGNWLTGNWTFWQYSENGIIEGVNSKIGRQTSVDLNNFNGNENDFLARFSFMESKNMGYPIVVKPNAGAEAYSPDGARPWGNALYVECIAVGDVGDKYLIDSPRWPANDKQWTVLQSQCTIIGDVEPPPVDPPAYEPLVITFEITDPPNVYEPQTITIPPKV